jgi:hypothetical protein
VKKVVNPLKRNKIFSHDSIECNKDLNKEANYEDEASVSAPPSDEAFQDPISPAQDEENELSHFPFHFFMTRYSMIQKVKK